jgi:S1-C subfamily serine protease
MAVLTETQATPPHKNIPAIARDAKGAVGSIVVLDKAGQPISQGSGFFISTDGRAVTNYHVIKNGASAVIKLPGGAFFAVDGVCAFDADLDVAIIKAHGNDFRTVALGDSDRLQVGEEVVAIGNPLSLESSVSNGILSGIRTVQEKRSKVLQITAPISPGRSGGPLFDMGGEVVGITTSHLRGGENLNFAIPINEVKPLLRDGFSKVQGFPDEPHSPPARTGGKGAPPSISTQAVALWKSQTTGNEYRVEIEGETLKAERMDLPKDPAHEGAYVRTTAQHQGSKWIGKTQIFLPCALGHGPVINKCHLTMGFEIMEMSSDLIRGRIENPDLRQFDCKSCNAPKKEWKDFVWVPKKQLAVR